MGRDRGKRTFKELDWLVWAGKVKIGKDWWAYARTGSHRKDAKILNERLEGVKNNQIQTADMPNLTKTFMENYKHNYELLQANGSSSMVDYDCRTTIKPMDIISDVNEWWIEIDEGRKEPATLAGICHKLRCSRKRLGEMLKNRGYDGAKTMIQNMLLKYAENYLFTWKNINGAVFYLKNLYPEIYQDKQTTETNVNISLSALSKKADALEFSMKQGNIIKGELATEPKDWKSKGWDKAESILFHKEKPIVAENDQENEQIEG